MCQGQKLVSLRHLEKIGIHTTLLKAINSFKYRLRYLSVAVCLRVQDIFVFYFGLNVVLEDRAFGSW